MLQGYYHFLADWKNGRESGFPVCCILFFLLTTSWGSLFRVKHGGGYIHDVVDADGYFVRHKAVAGPWFSRTVYNLRERFNTPGAGYVTCPVCCHRHRS